MRHKGTKIKGTKRQRLKIKAGESLVRSPFNRYWIVDPELVRY
jgi:hypothetical protein